MKRRIALGASRTLALYSFAGWVYIALVALVEPNTLGMRLTHFATFPHEDTFGVICFVVSLISYFVHYLLRTGEVRTGTASGVSPDQSETCPELCRDPTSDY